MNPILYYIHDPMCSWCWGYRPVWDALKSRLPDLIQVKYVAGGLAPDSNEAMPYEQQAMIEAHWHTIEKKLGTEFNFDFWRNNIPRRSTYNACRAVIAADNQGYQLAMIAAIQKAYYLHALNPSDSAVLIGLAKALSLPSIADKKEITPKIALDLSRFIHDFTAKETQQTLMKQIQLARELTQQGFPSLVLETNGKRHQIPINYQDYQATLALLNSVMTTRVFDG